MRLFIERVTVKEIIEETTDYYLAAAEGVAHPIICWKMLFPELRPGEDIIINTTAVRLGLGTGGFHLGLSPADGQVALDDSFSHIMKLNYTPLQHARPHLEELSEYAGINRFKVDKPAIVFTLHSQLFAAGYYLSQHKDNPGFAIILTDENALPAFMSKNIAFLKQTGCLKKVITAGQSFGGDIEAINVYSALAYASKFVDCELILVGPSFGTRGSGTYLGHSAMSALQNLHAVYSGGTTPYLAARVSFADPRPRHRGISHHTREVVELSLCPINIVLPGNDILSTEQKKLLDEHVRFLRQANVSVRFIDCSQAHEVFSQQPERFVSMGRNYNDDPYLFLSAAAPVIEVIDNA